MQRKALKNFVYSFLFSLSVTAIIGKVCFTYPENKPQKNNHDTSENLDISLFSKPADMLKIKQPAAIDVSAIDALTPIENKVLPKAVVTAELSDIAAPDVKSFSVEKTADTSVKTDLAYASEIILEDIKPSEPEPELKPDYEKSGIVYADISDTLEDEKIQSAPVVYQEKSQSAPVVYSQETVTDNNLPQTAAEDQSISDDFVIAQNSSAPEISENEDIPLTETSEVLHAAIEVSGSANASEIAMLEPEHLVSSIEQLDEEPEKTLAEADLKQDGWKQMSETKQDSPWIVAKGNKFAKNKMVVEQFADVTETPDEKSLPENEENQKISEAVNPEKIGSDKSEETKLAYQMVPNLLIPIPEDIANDPNLTPQLSVTPKDKTEDSSVKPEKKSSLAAVSENNTELSDKEKDSGLFKSITSWFSGSDKKSAENDSPEKQNNAKGFNFFGRGNSANNGSSAKTKILPAELRLSFQPNRAEISGQTLRWIHAFADNALNNDDMYIEVRIDGTSSFALQKKRLNLLSTIFANRGVDFRKINIVFTSREPNSFIIRNIRFNNNEEVVVNKKSGNSYYRPW